MVYLDPLHNAVPFSVWYGFLAIRTVKKGTNLEGLGKREFGVCSHIKNSLPRAIPWKSMKSCPKISNSKNPAQHGKRPLVQIGEVP